MYNYNIGNLKPDEVLVYLRKSRTDDPLLSVEEVLSKHETILDEWAERNLGGVIPEENKYREVVSGETIVDRPEVQKVLKLMESPKIKAILIVEVQRLSRGDLEDAGRLIKLIRYTNTLVITPMKTFNLTDEYDRDIFERELKRGNEYLEYQKKIMGRGRALSASQGNYINPNPPYGYDKIFVQEGKRKCPTLAIKEDEANVVRMIFDMYVNQQMGYNAISNRLDDLHITPPRGKYWSGPSIKEMLENVHYIGKIKWNWRKTVVVVENGQVKKTSPKSDEALIFDGKHPAIISEELFKAAQERRGKIPRVKQDFTVKNPFAGLIFCKCGHSLVHRSNKSKSGNISYTPRLLCKNQVRCNSGSCTVDQIMEFVVLELKRKIAEFEIEIKNNSDETINLHEKMIQNLENKLATLQAKELAQWEAQADPNPSKRMPQHIFQMLNTKLLKEKEEVELALKEAYDTMPTKVDYEQKIITFQAALDALQDDTKDTMEKNQLLKECIRRIDYHRERLEHLKGKGTLHQFSDTPIELDITFTL